MADRYDALKQEIANDPLALGYAGKTDAQIAALMNGADRSTTAPRTVVAAYEVWEAIVPADWAALTAQEKQRVQSLLGMGTVNLAGANTRASLAAAFAAGTPTRTNLTALQAQTVPRSRAQEIFGLAVTDQDILAARSR
jgi:hypothetical protein